MADTDTIDSAQLEAYLEFLAASGIDCMIDDEPRDWFAASEQQAAAAPQMHGEGGAAPASNGPRPRTVSVPKQAPEGFDAHTAAQSILQRQRRQSAEAASNGPQVGAVVPDAQAVSSARDMAQSAKTLDELRQILSRFEGCNLRLTAKNLVFGDGNPNAKLMLIGEAPGRDEDLQGVPFVGSSGQLLNLMLKSAGLKREDVYIANVVPWRPPGNRAPTPQETEICRPFVQQQIELVDPDIIVFMGAASAKALTGNTDGIRRLRGRWLTYAGAKRERKAIATFHPAYLLRTPLEKRWAWRDLLSIKAALKDTV